MQRLGSALVLSRACRDVRNELCKVRKFFENTATRFLGVLADDIKRKKLKHTKRKNRPRERRSSTSFDDHQNEISEALDNLYQALEMFLTAIRDFEDYSDSDGEQSLEKFMEQVGVCSVNAYVELVLIYNIADIIWLSIVFWYVHGNAFVS